LAGALNHYHDAIKADFESRIAKYKQHIPGVKITWSSDGAAGDRFNASKVALLIEPRPIPHLVPQILHMISVVPPDWRFLFIGSNQSVNSVGRSYATKHQLAIGKLDLVALPSPWQIDNKEHIFRLLTDVRFYDEFLPRAEWILKYEHDSILCANSNTSLNEWLDWDWAGSPK
jgi:hypothetical protein